MANDKGGADPDEMPTRPLLSAGAGATPPADGTPTWGGAAPRETVPTMPIVPARPAGSRRVGQLSPQERGIAAPRGLSGMTRNVRLTLVALSALLLVACCAASWGTASAIFPPPGAPVAAASSATLSAGSATSAAATASVTDQPTATLGGDATPTASVSPTDTPTPASPSPSPSSTPSPDPTPCPNPYCNPWGYNFTPGMVIYNPNLAFCSVFPCVSNFWGQFGYVVECNDLLFARDGGLPKTCRGHGGWYRTLYQH